MGLTILYSRKYRIGLVDKLVLLMYFQLLMLSHYFFVNNFIHLCCTIFKDHHRLNYNLRQFFYGSTLVYNLVATSSELRSLLQVFQSIERRKERARERKGSNGLATLVCFDEKSEDTCLMCSSDVIMVASQLTAMFNILLA